MVFLSLKLKVKVKVRLGEDEDEDGVLTSLLNIFGILFRLRLHQLLGRRSIRVKAAKLLVLFPREDRVRKRLVGRLREGILLHGGEVREIGASALGTGVMDLGGWSAIHSLSMMSQIWDRNGKKKEGVTSISDPFVRP